MFGWRKWNMIQVINFRGNKTNFELEDIVVNSIAEPESLDSFDINVIDFNTPDFWRSTSDKIGSVNSEKDLINLQTMITKSRTTKIVKIFPQNIRYNFDYGYAGRERSDYRKSEDLKNMLKCVFRVIVGYESKNVNLLYKNTKTIINSKQIAASFYFSDVDGVITYSVASQKSTTICYENQILTTLAINDAEILLEFLKAIDLYKDNKEQIPAWMGEIKMFDDNKQYDIIQKNNEAIKISQTNIENALGIIARNNRYKSILYTTGDELVDVIFEILEEMLGCDLHCFVDKKREDFSFSQNNIIYIGEIKGISSNVKSQNISQLEFHHQGFLDSHPEIDDTNLRQLLIINHQRTTAIDKRDLVDKKQTELAQKYGSLIIETSTLLRMYEQFRNGQITREDCFSLFDNKGLLSIE